ncbi:MAG: hypothetical protein WCF08_03300 [Anaerolineaceae bacterium]
MHTIHPARLSLLLMVITLVILSCGITLPTGAPVIPTAQPEPPSAQPPAEVTQNVVEATVNQPVYARAQIGSYLSIWVTYNPADWDAVIWITGSNQAGEQIQQLIHKSFDGCSMHDNLGHGAPETWSFGNYTKDLGQVVYQIDQWTDTTNSNPVLVVYQYPAGDQTNSTKRIELEPGSMPYDCINAADVVIGLSAADIIK